MKSAAAIILFAAAGCMLGQCATGRKGWAHDPYTGLTNPITGISCCSGGPTGDCKAVDPREIGEDGDSYTYQGARFPKRQTQQSPDQRYHVCAGTQWMLNGTSQPLIRCMMRPFSGSRR